MVTHSDCFFAIGVSSGRPQKFAHTLFEMLEQAAAPTNNRKKTNAPPSNAGLLVALVVRTHKGVGGRKERAERGTLKVEKDILVPS